MDTTVKCLRMAFSRCGQYLIVVGGVPDFRISIYDIENKKKVNMPETKLQCSAEEFLQVKFNPKTKEEFCILSTNSLNFYKIHPAYDVTERGDQKILGESFRL
jgi:WD40 repeat protein